MAWWAIPAIVTGASALLGYKSSKDANKTQQAAINAQQAAEAQKQALAQSNMTLADELLYGVGYVPGKGVDSKPGQGGAMELSKDWTTKYLDWLKNSPDITYNAQRGALEGNIRDSMEQAAQSLGRRGLNTGNVRSGAADNTLGNIAMSRAGLLSQLLGERYDRQGQRLSQGTQLTQSLMDRALNLRSAATGTAMNQQTMIPQMMMNQAAGQAQQAGAYGQLTGTLLDYLAQSRKSPMMLPTMPATSVSTVPNQFADFRYQPSPGSFGSF